MKSTYQQHNIYFEGGDDYCVIKSLLLFFLGQPLNLTDDLEDKPIHELSFQHPNQQNVVMTFILEGYANNKTWARWKERISSMNKRGISYFWIKDTDFKTKPSEKKLSDFTKDLAKRLNAIECRVIPVQPEIEGWVSAVAIDPDVQNSIFMNDERGLRQFKRITQREHTEDVTKELLDTVIEKSSQYANRKEFLTVCVTKANWENAKEYNRTLEYFYSLLEKTICIL